MPVTIEYKKMEPTSRFKKSNVPVIIEWHGSKMIRNHSIRAAVKEILTISESLDVVKINIIGNPGTGKTTLAKTLGHIIHKMTDIPYAIKLLTREDLLDFQNFLSKLQPTNYVLIFDDVSFLGASANKKQIEMVKKSMTEIRHLPGGQDVKIIAIFNFHYSLGLDKYIRQSNFSFYTSIGSSEMDNMQKTLGMKNTQKIEDFQRIHQMALLKKKFAYRLGKNWFIYNFRTPFVPALFYNSMTLRTIVFPKREWVDKLCSICIGSEGGTMKDGISVEEFTKDLYKSFGPQLGRNAIRLKLFQNGINVFPKLQKQAMQYIDKVMENKTVNLQQLADHCEFNNEPTRLDKKIEV